MRDPLTRVQRYLDSVDEWSEEWQREVEATASDSVEAGVEAAEALEPLDSVDIFEAMFADVPAPLAVQQGLAQHRGKGT